MILLRDRKHTMYLLIIIFIGLMMSFVFSSPQKSTKPHYSLNWNYEVQTNLHKVYQEKKFDIVMLGDSHTYRVNWNELLGMHNILNRGIDGDITHGFLDRLDDILTLNKPKYIFVLGGYNDFRKGYDLKDVFENYKKIIQKIRNAGTKVIITATFYDVKGNYREEITTLNVLMREYCKVNSIDYVDLNSKFSKDGYMLAQFSSDGIHLNAEAYTFWKLKLLERFSFLQ